MPFLIAHRGYSGRFRDNSAEAFEGAIKGGATMIETDLRVSADGFWVLHHEETFTFTFTDEDSEEDGEKERWVAKTPIADRPPGVLTLDDGLNLINGRVAVYCDIKGHPSREHLVSLVDKICDLCDRTNHDSSWALGQFWLASFDPATVKHLLEIRSTVGLATPMHMLRIGLIGLLHPLHVERDWNLPLKNSHLSLYGIDFAATNLELVDREYIDFVQRQNNLRIFVYTLNTPLTLTHYYDLGVDGLLTDHVDLFGGSFRG